MYIVLGKVFLTVVLVMHKIRDVYDGDVADVYCLLPLVGGFKKDEDEA